MSKKIGLRIAGRPFDVDVEEPFMSFLKQQMGKDFNLDGNNEVKILLQAYVRKNHELFLQEQKMKEMIKKIEQ
ncbi:MAG: hypothetical protein RBR54_03545 [Sulfurimonas sp.]|jgi:hypothetical protein|nr:hypothetical protein [Sulfurimonas sp.]